MIQRNWRVFVSLMISFFVSSLVYNFIIQKKSIILSFNLFTNLKKTSYKHKPTITKTQYPRENFFLPTFFHSPSIKNTPFLPSSPNIIKLTPSPTRIIKPSPTLKKLPTPTPTKRIITPNPSPIYQRCVNPERENYQKIDVLVANQDPPFQRRDLYLPPHFLVNVRLTTLNIPIHDPDPNVPLLYTTFNPPHTPKFIAAYKAEGEIQGDYPPEIDILEVETIPNEGLYFPQSGYNIGGGLAAMVIYADENKVTFKIGREDSYVTGYTLYFENLCVDKNLINLYRKLNNDGRNHLPAIYPRQFFGLTKNKLKIALRDTGMFLDIRNNGVIDDYKLWR